MDPCQQGFAKKIGFEKKAFKLMDYVFNKVRYPKNSTDDPSEKGDGEERPAGAITNGGDAQ